MAPVLHMIPASPPVRAVLMTAKELGVELDLKLCDVLGGQNLTDEYIKMNPAHTIPTLDDDGLIIWESAAIMGYLVNKYGKNSSLYPNDIKKRAIVDQLLHFSTSTFSSSVLPVFKPVVAFKQKKSTILQENIDKLFGALDVWEKLIGTKKYLTGDEYTIADFSFISWLSTVNIAFPIKSDRYPNITSWWKRIEQLPSYEANREGLSQFSEIWASRD